MDIRCLRHNGLYRFIVHLDTTKTLEDGTPDPAWVVEYSWSDITPNGQTTAQYLASCKREALLLAEMELAKRQPAQEVEI